MSHQSGIKKLFIGAASLVLAGMAGMAQAQPLDDVRLEYQADGVAATINLTGPVQYMRHFPENRGKMLEIFYNRIQGGAGAEVWQDNEVRNSPPTGLIPSFTVTTRDQLTKPKLVIEFAREAEYTVTTGKDNRSIVITIRPDRQSSATGALPQLPTILPAPAALPANATADQIAFADNNKQARVLMVQGRDALQANSSEAAVTAFNALLMLPPNDYTQDAQEWVGVARERSAQIDKAKIEYDLYLKLYPDGEGAARVAQRLAGLSGRKGGVEIDETGARKQGERWMTFGSISSRYYYGRSTVKSTSTMNNVETTSSLSLTDQSMLVSTLDLSERYVSEEMDGRLVLRDVNTKNFLSNKAGMNRVSAAYGEIKGRTHDYMLRLGRQTAMGGGVLGSFDGIAASYGDAQSMRFNASAGNLVDFTKNAKAPRFFSGSLDIGGFSFYGINQTVEGITDRRAVGAEWRYYENRNSAYVLFDYDLKFKKINAMQLMGSYDWSGSMVNVMVDRRKTPSLSIRNALNGATTSSINDLLQIMGYSQLQALALKRTTNSTMGQIGITVPLNEKWQAGADVRLAKVGGWQQSGVNPATNGGVVVPEGYVAADPGRGITRTLTGQVIGSSLYKEGDIWSGSLSVNMGGEVKGHTLYLYNYMTLNNGWMLNTSLQLYREQDQFLAETVRITPMLRGSYQINQRLYADVDGGFERYNFSGTNNKTQTTRYFISGGLRWDF